MAIIAPPQFNNYLVFGQSRVPLDTASAFTLEPDGDGCEITLYVDTLDGTPKNGVIGWGRFKIKTETMAKADAVISKLVESGVKCEMGANRVTLNFQNRTIDLFYRTSANLGRVKNPDGTYKTINWGKQFMMFKDALGLGSPDYKVECISPPVIVPSCWGCSTVSTPGSERIRFSFNEAPDVEDKMRDLVLTLDKLSDNKIISRLFNSDELPPECAERPLQFDEKPRRENPAYKFSIGQLPYKPPMAESAGFQFLVTEDKMEAHEIWGLNAGPWKPHDISWLIATSKRAPVQMVAADVAEGIHGNQMRAIEPFPKPRANIGAGNREFAGSDEGRS
jgi:hypothetical protein